jgi:CRP-like cAMP-binding protein
MYEQINSYLTKQILLSDEDLAVFNQSLELLKAPKKTLLLKEGDICRFEGFINKGCVKSYLIDKNGFEVILTFGIENWWVSDITAFQDQVPSRMYIETIEETELLVMTHARKEELLKRIPSLERVFRLMVQRHLAAYQERLFGNVALTAEERYDKFMEKHPGMSQRIPQHLIASYLGMSPEFLSRIRKRKVSKG